MKRFTVFAMLFFPASPSAAQTPITYHGLWTGIPLDVLHGRAIPFSAPVPGGYRNLCVRPAWADDVAPDVRACVFNIVIASDTLKLSATIETRTAETPYSLGIEHVFLSDDEAQEVFAGIVSEWREIAGERIQLMEMGACRKVARVEFPDQHTMLMLDCASNLTPQIRVSMVDPTRGPRHHLRNRQRDP